MLKIAVIGAGYVGLTTAACFAKMGHRVFLSEIDAMKANLICDGVSPIFEEGLSELLAEVIASGNLSITTDNQTAVLDSKFIFICLPTPQAIDGSANTDIVIEVIKSIKLSLNTNSILITKSTMPIGSVRRIQELVKDTGATVANNPEFLREGTAVQDTLHPERVVIGCDDTTSANEIAELYAPLNTQILITDPQSAELIKYSSNAFLAMKVTFINSVATLCDAVGADIKKVSNALGLDSRIGNKFLTPGPGWGGSCLPKDTSALLHQSVSNGHSFSLLETVIAENLKHQLEIVRQIESQLVASSGKCVALLGLTFKAGTDDLRDSPAIFIAQQLLNLGWKVNAYDPTIEVTANHALGSINTCTSIEKAIQAADLIVVMTEWPEFSTFNPADSLHLISCRHIFDTRGIIDKKVWTSCGFTVKVLGRP